MDTAPPQGHPQWCLIISSELGVYQQVAWWEALGDRLFDCRPPPPVQEDDCTSHLGCQRLQLASGDVHALCSQSFRGQCELRASKKLSHHPKRILVSALALAQAELVARRRAIREGRYLRVSAKRALEKLLPRLVWKPAALQQSRSLKCKRRALLASPMRAGNQLLSSCWACRQLLFKAQCRSHLLQCCIPRLVRPSTPSSATAASRLRPAGGGTLRGSTCKGRPRNAPGQLYELLPLLMLLSCICCVLAGSTELRNRKLVWQRFRLRGKPCGKGDLRLLPVSLATPPPLPDRSTHPPKPPPSTKKLRRQGSRRPALNAEIATNAAMKTAAGARYQHAHMMYLLCAIAHTDREGASATIAWQCLPASI